MTVVPTRVGDDRNVWAYSTGLYYSYGHPEILLFNLRRENLIKIINVIGARIKSGEKFESAKSYANVLEGYQCAFRAVDSSNYKEYVWVFLVVLRIVAISAVAVFLAGQSQAIPMGKRLR